MSGFVFSEKPIELQRGEGVHLYDTDGTAYLDVGASYACVPVGHANDRVVDAATDQLQRLPYVQASYPVDARTELYEKLADVAPGDLEKVWLCNSGTEANEAALKFARHATGRSKIVAATRAFHGRTMGALAATWNPTYREGFEPLVPDVEFVDYGDSDALQEAIDTETAAVILEPIQGEGGVNPATEEYLQTARDVATDAGAALVFDEVQTGMGRTGTLWAGEQAAVTPDVLTTAKGLANGLPIGATLCADWIAENAGNHGSTFSGGPAIAAAANATLDQIVEEDLPSHAASIGRQLQDRLRDTLGGSIRNVRGRGLLVGVEVKRDANPAIRDLALEEHVLALPAGRTVIRLLPPLVLQTEHIDQLVAAFENTVPETTEP